MADESKMKPCGFCGVMFTPSSRGQRFYCSSECQRLHHNKKLRDNARMKNEAKKLKRDPIDDIVHEIVAYNKAHGTNINYGQWVGGIRKGHGI